jgi:2-keto-4-pentenoate hydratase/2-oxohepta-3-ene-1,7-dioic acid hydratase in catechol pathway
MKLITFEFVDGRRHLGAILTDGLRLVDFTASSPAPWFRDMLGLIDGGEDAMEAAKELVEKPKVVHRLSTVRLCAPLVPRQMRDFLCFEMHLRQVRANRHFFDGPSSPLNPAPLTRIDPATVEIPAIWYKEPIYYKCNRFSVIGTDVDVIRPSYCSVLDYELEFGIILGKGGKNIRREDARDHIFGYLIFNDFSARDQQIREIAGNLGPSKGKDFDTGNVLGPWLVTADEIADPYNLSMVARVNGEEWSRGNSSSMHHRFEDVLAHVSKDETLYAGEFFGSGTVGTGCCVEVGRFFGHHDIIELEVDGLGVLRNRVVFQ